MDIVNIIRKRKSSRTYNSLSLKESDRDDLQKHINTNKIGLLNQSVDFVIFEKEDTSIPLKIPYGLIKGNKTYIFGKTGKTRQSRINYGYQLEKIVLEATKLKLDTCWVGLFDREYFYNIEIENDLDIPSIVVIGYANEKTPLKEKLIRKVVNADKRKPWDKLFFDYETNSSLNKNEETLYSESLEMTRLAPSSGNTQPWRIFYSKLTNEFHFFKKITNMSYESKGMHDIDMGIAMSHFELVSNQNGLKGTWIELKKEEIKTIDDLHYIITWKCNN